MSAGPRRVLVTGATGIIGRHVIALLAQRGEDVHAVARCPAPGPAPGSVAWHATDLLQPGAGAALVERVAPTHLLHLAWNTEPGRYWSAPDNLDWVAASLGLLRAFAAGPGRRAVFAGSCAEYAWSDETLSEDGTPIRPASLYGSAKAAMHQCVAAAAGTLGLSYAWGRVFFVYGPHEAQRRLIPEVVRSLLAGREALCTPGLQQRDFMHTTDVAAAFVALLDSDWHGPVNVASGRCVEVREIVRTLGALIGRPELVRLGARAAPAGEPMRLAADVRILQERIGFRPEVSLDDGLADAVEWWRAHDTQGAPAQGR